MHVQSVLLSKWFLFVFALESTSQNLNCTQFLCEKSENDLFTFFSQCYIGILEVWYFMNKGDLGFT